MAHLGPRMSGRYGHVCCTSPEAAAGGTSPVENGDMIDWTGKAQDGPGTEDFSSSEKKLKRPPAPPIAAGS